MSLSFSNTAVIKAVCDQMSMSRDLILLGLLSYKQPLWLYLLFWCVEYWLF